MSPSSKGRQYTKQRTKGKSKRVRSLQQRKGHAKLERRYDLVDSPSPSKDELVDSPSPTKDDSFTNDDLSVSSSESESGGMKPAAKKTSK